MKHKDGDGDGEEEMRSYGGNVIIIVTPIGNILVFVITKPYELIPYVTLPPTPTLTCTLLILVAINT